MTRVLLPAAAGLLIALASTGCGERTPTAPVSKHWQRVDASGHILSSAESSDHRCVLDPRTGLMWQVHVEESRLHDPNNRYSWFSPDRQVNMGEAGKADGGQCEGSACDSQALVDAVNREGLCAHDDWRLPSREELFSLGDERLRESGLIVDSTYFPEAVGGEYWTSETFRLYPQSAWAVDFGNGLDRADLKTEAKSVRLVRRHRPPGNTE